MWNPEHLDKVMPVVHFRKCKKCSCGAVDVQAREAVKLEGVVYYNCPRCMSTRALREAETYVGPLVRGEIP
jgi:hypothetical protein